MTGQNKKQLYIPDGFAHGFLTLSDTAEFLYKTTDFYSPVHEQSIIWNDETIGIKWPFEEQILLSRKDMHAKSLEIAQLF